MTEQEAVDIMCDLLDDISHHHTDSETLWSEEREEAFSMAESALEEIQQYRAIGTVEEIKRIQKYAALAKKHDTIGKIVESCAEYEEIGSVEDFWDAREKQKAKKPIKFSPCRSVSYYKCPVCDEMLVIGKDFCCKCGQKIDWNEDEDLTANRI